MDRIKSAWEIAMEKAKQIKDIPEEELKKEFEERCQMAGRALADRYLATSDERQLKEDLEKYQDEEKNMIRKTALGKLTDALELGKYENLEKIMDGIFYLTGNERVKQVEEKIRQLFGQYEQAMKDKRDEVEIRGKKILNKLKISGNAIRAINPRAKREWEQSLKDAALPYLEKLEGLKQELLAAE